MDDPALHALLSSELGEMLSRGSVKVLAPDRWWEYPNDDFEVGWDLEPEPDMLSSTDAATLNAAAARAATAATSAAAEAKAAAEAASSAASAANAAAAAAALATATPSSSRATSVSGCDLQPSSNASPRSASAALAAPAPMHPLTLPANASAALSSTAAIPVAAAPAAAHGRHWRRDGPPSDVWRHGRRHGRRHGWRHAPDGRWLGMRARVGRGRRVRTTTYGDDGFPGRARRAALADACALRGRARRRGRLLGAGRW